MNGYWQHNVPSRQLALFGAVGPVPRLRRPSRAAARDNWVPPGWMEHTYFATMFYVVLADIWGVRVPMAGAAALAILAARCILREGMAVFSTKAPIALPLCCAVSFLAVQVLAFDDSLFRNRDFIVWILSLIVLQALTRRPGFLHRFVTVMLLVGIMALPYLQFASGSVERLVVEEGVGGNLANANGFGQWFGFAAVYMVIAGMQTKRYTVRAVSWAIAVICMALVGLTVSRGALVAVIAAIAVAFRQSLRRAFAPVLVFVLVIWIAYEFGMFATAIDLYTTRGMEETGRSLVWPLAWARFTESPLWGVGIGDVKTYIRPEKGITPHNSFLLIGLSSGIVPLALYVAYWCRAVLGAFRGSGRLEEASFVSSLLMFALLPSLTSNYTFTTPWATVAMLIAARAAGPRARRWKTPANVARGNTRRNYYRSDVHRRTSSTTAESV